jgi:IS30 family transposase
VNPFPLTPPPAQGRYLSFAEREEVAVLAAAGLGVREIGRRLGRSASTISRELSRAGQAGYRASVAQSMVDAARHRRRPGRVKLLQSPRLRRQVQDYLRLQFSPEQIAGRLRLDYPDDAEMRLSAETIYQALYVQARGALNRELTSALRSGRTMRKPRRVAGERAPRFIAGMVMIAQRPAEVEDRAVPGHWEGDLILGSTESGSSIGTLVERTTGFLMLLHLPEGHNAEQVAAAASAKIGELPTALRRSLTWDQGPEMARHDKITLNTGMPVYFCDPRSPWQRGSNENTNGLLRQYFPKGTDLSRLPAHILDEVADQMNHRPRKRHGFRTPAEVLTTLLDKQGVASPP